VKEADEQNEQEVRKRLLQAGRSIGLRLKREEEGVGVFQDGRKILITSVNLKVGCLHPVACTTSGSGFPSNATLV
jgi:hypothetical protein